MVTQDGYGVLTGGVLRATIGVDTFGRSTVALLDEHGDVGLHLSLPTTATPPDADDPSDLWAIILALQLRVEALEARLPDVST